MKLKFILSLVVAILFAGNFYANNSRGVDDGLILEGEFTHTGSRSVKPALPMSADIISNVLHIEFSAPVGDVKVTVSGPVGVVYTSSANVTAVGQQLSFSLDSLAPGAYLLEFMNSHGGYVYGQFVVD